MREWARVRFHLHAKKIEAFPLTLAGNFKTVALQGRGGGETELQYPQYNPEIYPIKKSFTIAANGIFYQDSAYVTKREMPNIGCASGHGGKNYNARNESK